MDFDFRGLSCTEAKHLYMRLALQLHPNKGGNGAMYGELGKAFDRVRERCHGEWMAASANRERAKQSRANQERANRARANQERANQERANQERANRERANRARANQERANRERANRAQANRERANRERANRERANRARANRARANRARANQARGNSPSLIFGLRDGTQMPLPRFSFASRRVPPAKTARGLRARGSTPSTTDAPRANTPRRTRRQGAYGLFGSNRNDMSD